MNMKKFLVFTLAVVAFWGCVKNNYGTNSCQSIPPSDEATEITAFCYANGINFTKDTNGIFYQIIDTGTGVTPTLSSTISVTYHATLLNGALVDSTLAGQVFTANLSSLIPGWQIAIPYIKKGGHIKMVLPSAFSYGCYGTSDGHIAPNSVIYFDLNLVNVL